MPFVATAICSTVDTHRGHGQGALSFKNDAWPPNSVVDIFVDYGSIDGGTAGRSTFVGTTGYDVYNTSNNKVNLNYVDPPFSPFTVDNLTFSKFLNADGSGANRNGCQNNVCPIDYVPGHTVKHEFFHTLGLLHEHQNNLNGSDPINFNKSGVISYYTRPEIGWTTEEVNSNILDKYSDTNYYDGTNYDKLSIMLYSMPNQIQDSLGSSYVLINGPSIQSNFQYSSMDLKYLLNNYPLGNYPLGGNVPVFNIHFPATNSNDVWKNYWIKSILTELSSKIGVVYNFIDIGSHTNSAPSISGAPGISGVSIITNSSILDFYNSNKPWIIALAVILGIILLFFIKKLLF